MNCQLLRKAFINYQLDQNRTFNYQRQPFFPFHQLEGGLKEMVNGSCDRHVPFYIGACWKMVVIHGGKRGRK